MDDEKLLLHLRSCFVAGYTVPQCCMENKIRKPLFVISKFEDWQILWEIYLQFSYDKRITAEFALLFKGSDSYINYSPLYIIRELVIKDIDSIDIDDYDKIIFLSSRRVNINGNKIIYLDELVKLFLNRAYCEIPLLHFLQAHTDIKLIVVNCPLLSSNLYSTEREKDLEILKAEDKEYIFQLRGKIESYGFGNVSTPYDFLGYDNRKVYDLLEIPKTKVNPDGSTTLLENSNRLLAIRGGKRLTAFQPDTWRNKIYFVGNCVYFGFGVPFEKTVASVLQKLLNEKNFPYRVENESQFFADRSQDIFYNLQNLPVKPNDIVFVCLDSLSAEYLPFLDVENIFKRPHEYGEVFADFQHINELGHAALAEKFFQLLTENNFFQGVELKYPSPPLPPHRYGIPRENFSSGTNFFANKELEEYKKFLREKKIPVGAIVMNCNPFTLGHEYLIECAAKRVQKLFVFVVEEDRSEFSFEDRIKLVREGVKKFSNAEVLPSGKFIISQRTFSGYFNKENLQDKVVDSSEDVEIFAREIAPTLGITVRFAGEEPEDSVTRQYNETMKKILPQHGIEFCEIPRREIGGEVISAKKVREALKTGDFERIKKFVPETTLKFLREKNFS